MSFIDDIKQKAKSNIKTIVLPEATDIRVLKAARKVTDEGFAKVILLGNKEELKNIASDFSIDDIDVVDPLSSDKLESYIQTLFE